MDYLTVPAMASLEKAVPKDDQVQVLASGSPGTSGAAASQASGMSLSIPVSQDLSTITSITSGTTSTGSKARESRRLSKFHRARRTSKAHSTQRSKVMAKSARHHRKRKRRRLTLKELLSRSWQSTHPYLVALRQIIYNLTQSIYFDIFICSVVAVNTILLVVQTFAVVEIRGEWFFSAMDPIFLSVYVVEAILKLIALDFDYFHDPWNDIDFFIMIMTVLDFVLSLFTLARKGNRGNTLTLFRVLKVFKGIRAIRSIRFLLTLRVMENLQEVTSTFMLSSQSIGAIILLMFSFLFMSSVLLRDMFHEADSKHFGDLFKTIFTLFQLFTLDDWSLIYLTCYAAGAWYIIFFLIIYILVEYFLLLNRRQHPMFLLEMMGAAVQGQVEGHMVPMSSWASSLCPWRMPLLHPHPSSLPSSLVIAVLVDNFQMALLKRQELKKRKVSLQLREWVCSQPEGRIPIAGGLALSQVVVVLGGALQVARHSGEAQSARFGAAHKLDLVLRFFSPVWRGDPKGGSAAKLSRERCQGDEWRGRGGAFDGRKPPRAARFREGKRHGQKAATGGGVDATELLRAAGSFQPVTLEILGAILSRLWPLTPVPLYLSLLEWTEADPAEGQLCRRGHGRKTNR
ncbi:Cation channel sperm-associated protein 1 [Varanus komodoensis]|nr:Cation channel sperm-associated protein 1 [Varanus komodoensis]